MKNLVIEKMDFEHIDAVYKIEEESFFTPWSKKSIRTEVSNPLGRYIVILVDNEVVSYGGFWLVGTDANINNIAVKETHRGKGISKILMNKLIEMAREEKATDMYLEVRQSNKVAQSLYRSLNFKMIGLRKGYYVDTDEDAIVMHAILN